MDIQIKWAVVFAVLYVSMVIGLILLAAHTQVYSRSLAAKVCAWAALVMSFALGLGMLP